MKISEQKKERWIRWFLLALSLTLLINLFSYDYANMNEGISETLAESLKESNLSDSLAKNHETESISLDIQSQEDEEFEEILAMFTEDFFGNEIIDSDSENNNGNDIDQSLQNENGNINHISNELEGYENLEDLKIEDVFGDNEIIEVNKDLWDIDKVISKLNLKKEKRVAAVAKHLWIDWEKEKSDYAKLAWIQWDYVWSLDQNQKIRDYLIYNTAEIYKEKHGWNDWDRLALTEGFVDKNIKLNSKPITWQITYNDVTLNVTAPAGSFPEWTTLRIKSLGDQDSTTKLDITLKEVQLMTQVDKVEYDAPMASFDISFYAPDDVEYLYELQPVEWKQVSVVFDYENNDEFNNEDNNWFLAIYHMVENDETSIANLVGLENSEQINYDTKSDSIGIYADELSVYILTVVSDLDEENNEQTITFNVGSWEIVPSNNILISSSCTGDNCIYTWKILSNNNSITLPDIYYSWYNFGWWYNENKLLWYAGNIFNLWNSNSSTWEGENTNFEIYACLYSEGFTWNICTLNENLDSDLNILDKPLTGKSDAYIEAYKPTEEEIQKYGEDVFIAYNWAINNWITTIDDVSKVKFNKKITRAELAKMMVEYMSWTLQKEPIITWEVNYTDVDTKKLWDLAWYIQLAYQYQIMWINADWTPIEDFNPNKTVTRAEFSTVLSRVLFGNIYNQNWSNYYEKHIDALAKANIISNTNPNLLEARWWIMIMLYKSQTIIEK